MKRTGFIDGRRVAGFTLSGSSALNGMTLTIADSTTPASGYTRAMYINYTGSGAKTGSAEINCLGIDLALSAAVAGYAYNISLYLSSSGNPTLSFVSPISIYADDMGTGCAGFVGIDIGLALSNAPSGRHCFMRMRNHVSTAVTDGIRIEGSAPLTNLLYFQTDSSPIVASAVGGSQNHKIKISIAGTAYYIPLNTA